MDYGDRDKGDTRESSCERERYSNGEERRDRDRLNNEEHLPGTSHGVGRGNGHDSESYALGELIRPKEKVNLTLSCRMDFPVGMHANWP